jgi:hypothetical protein
MRLFKREAFYRSKEGGALSPAEARAKAYHPCRDEKEAKRIFSEVMSIPIDRIRFIDIAQMWPVAPRVAENLWEMMKADAAEEFESGHLASKTLTPTLYLRTAWTVAKYLGLRESFIAEWQSRGGIELSCIDMMAESVLMFQYWLEQSVVRSKTEPRKSSPGFIQWLEAQNPRRDVSSGYTNGHWDIPYVSEQAAIDHAAQMADRWHRIFMRTLRNLRDLRRFAIIINNPRQVNIAREGGQQVNVA